MNVEQTISYVIEKHKGQERKKSKIPYCMHLFDVTSRVSHYGFNQHGINNVIYIETMQNSSLGHDLIEDTETTYEELCSVFGLRVADIIKECTRVGGDDVTKVEKWSFLKSFESKSKESVVIKIADRFCNVNNYLETDAKYAAKYALQAWPLYMVFKSKFIDEFDENISNAVLNDIDFLVNLAGGAYSEVNADEIFKIVTE